MGKKIRREMSSVLQIGWGMSATSLATNKLLSIQKKFKLIFFYLPQTKDACLICCVKHYLLVVISAKAKNIIDTSNLLGLANLIQDFEPSWK